MKGWETLRVGNKFRQTLVIFWASRLIKFLSGFGLTTLTWSPWFKISIWISKKFSTGKLSSREPSLRTLVYDLRFLQSVELTPLESSPT